MGSQSRRVTVETLPKCPRCKRLPLSVYEPMAGYALYWLRPASDVPGEVLQDALGTSRGPVPDWVLEAVENDGAHGTGPCWARCNGPDGCGHEWKFRGQFAKLDKWSE